MEQVKTCKGCNITKPKTEFYHHNSNNDGLNGKCKDCIKAYSKRIYDNAMQDPFLRRQMAEKIKNYNERIRKNTGRKL
jgi:hypothetical protein